MKRLAGVMDWLWEISDLVRMLEEWEEKLLAEQQDERLRQAFALAAPQSGWKSRSCQTEDR